MTTEIKPDPPITKAGSIRERVELSWNELTSRVPDPYLGQGTSGWIFMRAFKDILGEFLVAYYEQVPDAGEWDEIRGYKMRVSRPRYPDDQDRLAEFQREGESWELSFSWFEEESPGHFFLKLLSGEITETFGGDHRSGSSTKYQVVSMVDVGDATQIRRTTGDYVIGNGGVRRVTLHEDRLINFP